ncbi:CMRF35-like molecule 6 isoform X2 [Osmerus mordax]|uniref:CMRF35-like molecule 6 isoform X2 n=1 Tax=Osmerus mordax TaxID=8014 RepID=UPI00350ECDEC
MKTHLVVSCCLLSAVCFLEAEMITDKGSEGSNVSFTCSHSNAWSHNKYLCRDPCTDDQDKIVTVTAGGTAGEGRISLKDSGSGDLTVTFSQLQKADSGSYWCGVERTGYDSYIHIQLQVLDAPKTTPPMTTTTPLPTTTASYTSSTFSSSVSTFSYDVSSRTSPGFGPHPSTVPSAGSVLVYATVGVVLMVAVLGLALFVVFRKWRRNREPVMHPSIGLGSSLLKEIHISPGTETKSPPQDPHPKTLTPRPSP